ncbi:hypothetical protein DO97_06750 [Neosynechococcus sphagnicola sy1]|uniref:SbsA Ig-like domain-containing protein n=1 Tax=Neosynechococcus sphagnicola sy1 TaxID=1497020 RepID=A0A098TLF4_9CYAN|nr:Ig-like domain-containing protein [Neosynechococcus sphagnicola]KGF72707.1 hypothetical protein DO97_06750 [Neosynechococcus sphagnicola sy1]
MLGSRQFPPLFSQVLDRVALTVIAILGLLIALLLWSGDHSVPRVRDFSWQERLIGAEDTAFVLTFSRPMNPESVEANLQVGPPLPGRISWAGRRLAYTLNAPAPYGTQYKLQLQGAKDRFTADQDAAIAPFTGQFQTRDRAFAYIGVTGAEAGRLILYNLTRQQKQILTPTNLVVLDFKFYPEGQQILFSATDRGQQPQGLLDQKLYTVTTGLPLQATRSWDWLPWLRPPSSAPGVISQVLDSRDYQNLKFDLSADGLTIVVQRVGRKNPGDSGLWILQPHAAPQPLKNQPGGDFLITPDSQAIAIAQGQGLAILPLTPAAQPLDFLPKFGLVMGFSRDGAQALMLKFNQDYTRSLFLVTNQGMQKQLLRTTGSVLKAQFDPTNQLIYCLLTELLPGKTYREEPYLAAFHLQQNRLVPLLRLPDQRDIQFSLSPDGLALLLDQVVTTTSNTTTPTGMPMTTDGKMIASSRLWLLPLPQQWQQPVQIQPVALPLPGLHPQWLP